MSADMTEVLPAIGDDETSTTTIPVVRASATASLEADRVSAWFCLLYTSPSPRDS